MTETDEQSPAEETQGQELKEVKQDKPKNASDDNTFKPDDMFTLYSITKKRFLLFVVAATTILLPISDTIYLPSLPTIQEDMNTTYTNASLTVALYTIAIGVFPLVWGPLVDYYGRKKTLIISLLVFVASCVGCLLSPNIASLIAFRVVQGIGISSVLIVATSSVTDTWAPEERGSALGFCGIPLLVGPVIGPVVGGAVANAFNWRATFVVLIVLGCLGVLSAIFVLEETLPYFAFNRKVAPKRPGEANPFPVPQFLPPWMPLKFFAIPSVLILALGLGLCFTAMFTAIILLPDVLVKVYGLNELTTGLCFLPIGFGALIGSPIGGNLADRVSNRLKTPAGATMVACFGLTVMIPISVATGWYMKSEAHLAGLLILNAAGAFCFCFAMPGVQSFAVSIVPGQAGAVMGLLQLCQFGIAGIIVWISTPLADAIGYGWLFTILAGIQVFTASAMVCFTVFRFKQDKEQRQNATVDLE